MTHRMRAQRYVLHKNDPARPSVLAHLHAFLERLPLDTSFAIEIKHYRRMRTLKQGSALFGVAYKAIMEFCGYEGRKELERLHTHYCCEFFGTRKDPWGKHVPLRTTTTNENGEEDVIDTVTASAFYDFIQRDAARLGCDVPDPDPLWFEKENAP